MKKKPHVFLSHILESIHDIENYTKEISQEDFFQSKQLQDSVIRRLEVIGEAARSIPEEFRTKHASIPWKDIAGMRDKLIHGYFGVDLELVWNVVVKELPQLKNQIAELLEEKQ